jgi:hypothetical protein
MLKKNITVVGLLLFIMALGAYLRFVNLDYGVEDEMTRPDEWDYKNYVLTLTAKITDQELPNSIHRFYGAYMNFIGMIVGYSLFDGAAELFNSNPDSRTQYFVNAIHDPHSFVMRMRFANLLFSVGALFIVFLIGNELFGKKAGVLSAAVCAISPLLITEGKSGKEDSFVLFFLLLGTYALVVWIKNEKFWSLRLCGFAGGVAFGSKVFGILLVPLIFLKISIDYLKGLKNYSQKILITNATLKLETFLLYFAGGYLFFNLSFLISPIELLRSYSRLFHIWGPKLERTSNIPFFLFEALPYGVGWFITVVAAISIVYFIIVKNWRALSLATLSLMILVSLNTSSIAVDRYIIFLVPACAILAFGFVTLTTSNKAKWVRIGLPSLVFLVAIFQLYPTAIATNSLLGKPSTRQLTGEYLSKEMKNGESALILRYHFWLGQGPMYGLNPVKRDWFKQPEWMEKAREHVAFDNVEFLSIDNLRDRKPDWIVVEYHSNGQISILPDKMKDAENLLLNNYEELYSVSPAQDFEKVKFNSWALPLSGFQYAQTYGPRIKIFKNKAQPSISGGDSQN